MPIHQKIEHTGGLVAVWCITETLDELYQKAHLSASDVKQVNAFKLESRQKEWLAVRALLAECLPRPCQVFYKQSGAPYLNLHHWHLGISHTRNFAAISLSPHPTALDIEKASPRIEKVYTRFVSREEQAYIPSDEQMHYFNLLWAAKETLYKLLDDRHVIFNKHFMVDPFTIQKEGTLNSHIRFNETAQDLSLNYCITPDYSLVYYLKNESPCSTQAS
jgi:phosphopantetheinyl transferase (holo-ACP synthase)